MVGVSPSLISQIERGQSQPSVATLFALAESLDVPVDAFFVKEEPATAAETERAEKPGSREPDVAASTATPAQRYLVRRDARAAINIEGGVLWERLTPETLPTSTSSSSPTSPGRSPIRSFTGTRGPRWSSC